MKKLIENFISAFLKKLNEYYTAYYEKADKNGFPYLVVPTISLRPLNAGYTTLVDIEIYNNELSTISCEEIADNLKSNLDGFVYNDPNIAFYLGFDGAYLGGTNEQDLSMKKLTYEVRIFEKGGI